jgi:hypothetical protein
MSVLHTRNYYDLSNPWQRKEAAGLIFRVAAEGCKGSLEYAFETAQLPYGWRPDIDGRTAEGRAFNKAEADLIAALATYDRARLAAIAKAKGASSQTTPGDTA